MKIALIGAIFMALSQGKADFPRNNLGMYDRLDGPTNVTEEQFNKITDAIISIWQPIAKAQGANLVAIKNWKDSTVNAYANQQGNTWQVHMFGGLARRPEVTPDGYALVVCHELGHHFGGYAFYGPKEWAASEGQADYFATEVCAKRVFSQFFDRRFMHREDVPPYVKSRCDAAWNTAPLQSLCYRSAAGGYSLANLLAKLGGNQSPKFETPDPSKVSKTNTAHPAAQCRLDTYFAGALCTAPINLNVIPGKDLPDRTSVQAEMAAAQTSCMDTKKYQLGFRPLCWFKPQNQWFAQNVWRN